ncbi:ubiquinone biosynthesis monooxygenase COQ6, mitochondrial-like [Pyrus communis]|uniref:ubiquinone biosynthesis monooxygenase COQ6, mitochondrial-like n=1 Tax=Pyrus communis TaxID=23211 RepID=UPI0035C1E1FA
MLARVRSGFGVVLVLGWGKTGAGKKGSVPHLKSRHYLTKELIDKLTEERALAGGFAIAIHPSGVRKTHIDILVSPGYHLAIHQHQESNSGPHTVHPLAGQGVNLGFGDAFALSRIICEGIAVGTDITDELLLKKYEAERKSANVTMIAILDSFQKAYSVDFGPLNVLRAAAFNGTQYIPPFKRSIISYASGDQRSPIFS